MTVLEGTPVKQEGTPVKQLATVLAALDRVVRADFKSRTDVPHGLSFVQYQVLCLLAEQGACAQQRVATHLGVTGPTVVRIIDALERKTLVSRTRYPTDRRRVYVALSARGVRAQQTCAAWHEQRLALLLTPLPAPRVAAVLSSLAALLAARTATD